MEESVMVSGWASETVQFTSDAFTIKAFLARPNGSTSVAPAVLLLHEWWGLTEHIKDVARRFASEGYAALAPDLYSRLEQKVAQTPQEAAVLMNALSSQAVLRDLNASTAYLKTQSFVDPLRISVVGFSMGGTFALTQAAHNSDLKAVVAFYGKVPPIETFRYLLCPVLYHYAARDSWVTRQEVDRLRQGFQQFGKPGAVCEYHEADHAFFNETRPEVYRPADATLAWERTLRFLQALLPAPR
jgi:carboxymethylenebutenolidase